LVQNYPFSEISYKETDRKSCKNPPT